MNISEDQIKNIQTQSTICTAGKIKTAAGGAYHGMWLAAIIDRKYKKIRFSTAPTFETKKKALAYCNDMKHAIKSGKQKAGKIIAL